MSWQYPTNFTLNNESLAVEGVGTLLGYAQYASGGWFGFGMLVLIFLMVFTISGLIDIRKSLASASFVTLIFSVYFARLNLVNPNFTFVLIAMTIAGFFVAKSGTPSNY
jgi:hypothetical protein